MESKNKSIYIHIPFCDTICSYCDFCKFIINHDWVKEYLKALNSEIKDRYKGNLIETIYIGGGTPSSLSISELKELFKILKQIKMSKTLEFTFECNIESIDYDKLKILYENGVNRLSIGVQTFNKHYLKYLNRNHTKEDVINKIKVAKDIGFKNINIDLIYAIKNQALKELEEDINSLISLDITHISTYSLMIEPNTKLYIEKEKNIDEDLDYEMYKLICEKLKNSGYKHYEISNFAKEGFESKHNLTYWNNLEYYGFGLGASGYENSVRYDNTKNLNKYIKGEYVGESHKLNKKEILENEFILGFRKIDGINKNEFKKKYSIELKSVDTINKLLNEKKLLENEKNIYINPKYIYVSNDILLEFIN